MKIVVIGGTGRVGGKLVYNLRQDDYQVLEASPSCGVDTVTAKGLAAALTGAQVVVDVSNAPSLEGDAPLKFFEASSRNLVEAARTAGVGHHVVLSIVGADRLDSEYFRAKKMQEDWVRSSDTPFTILRSTPFFDAISSFAQTGDMWQVVVPPALVQPIHVEDLAEGLADIATGDPENRTVEMCGPEQIRLDDLATEVLTAYEDPRRIVADPMATYFGAKLGYRSLIPKSGAVQRNRRFEDWLRDSLQMDNSSSGPIRSKSMH